MESCPLDLQGIPQSYFLKLTCGQERIESRLSNRNLYNEINVVVEEMYQLLGETVVEVISSVSGDCVLFGKGVMISH